MEARAKAEEDNHGSPGVCDDNLDDLFDRSNSEDCAPNMGSL